MVYLGLMFLMRGALVLFLIILGAVVRTSVGPSRKRGHIMLAGTLGGMAFGVLLSYLLPSWLKMDESAVLAVFGLTLGWGVAWLFAKQVPRKAD